MTAIPDTLFLSSTTESVTPNWGTGRRRCDVVARLSFSSGGHGWLVTLDEPIPASNGSVLDQVILADRVSAYSIDRLQVTGSATIGEGWVPIYVCRVDWEIAEVPELNLASLTIEYWGEAALSTDALPKARDVRAAWDSSFDRIRRYVAEHGHSRVPDEYFDEDGRLDVMVNSIRWHHAGRSGIGEGPFPGVDFQSQLNELEGWSWELPDS